jgi:hypothetical protein
MAGFNFLRRRSEAAAEGLLTALLAALIAGLAGLGPLADAADRDRTATVEGVFIVRHGDDFKNGRTVSHSYALSRDGAETELKFEGKAPADRMAGLWLSVRGHYEGPKFLVAAGGTQGGGNGGGSAAAMTGSRSVAVVLINFANDPSAPYTPAYAAGVAFDNANSVSAYYAASSWGQLSLSGQVFGWYTLPDTNLTCSTSTWGASAAAAALVQGVDLGAFDHVVYAFPYVAACHWAGLASMPGRTSWLNGQSAMALRTMAHELGHNLGTHHASTLDCTQDGSRVALSESCSLSEYGDPFTVMGTASHFEHTNFARGNFGWLNAAQAETVNATGEYSLSPIETSNPASAQVLQIPRGDSGTYLTLEFRQPDGTPFDDLAISSPVANGVTLRETGSLSATGRSRLIDTTPTTSSYIDAALAVGQTVTDATYGVSVTTTSVSSSAAIVRIEFGPSRTPTPSGTPPPVPTSDSSPEPTASPTSTPPPTPTPTPTPTPDPDAEPPTPPGALRAAIAKGKKVALSWSERSDNVGVAGYRVFRNGVQVGTTSGTAFVDTLRGKSATFSYYVVAFDASGNLSPPSASVSISP